MCVLGHQKWNFNDYQSYLQYQVTAFAQFISLDGTGNFKGTYKYGNISQMNGKYGKISQNVFKLKFKSDEMVWTRLN